MKNLLNIYRYIVGPEYGFTGEGNEQWYYTLACAINIMLTWWMRPEIGTIFSILTLIHYMLVARYGANDLAYDNPVMSSIYFGILIILGIVAVIVDIKWAIITSIITTVAVFIAPDCTGNNIFLRKPNVRNKMPLLFNTIMFAAFVVVDFLLPVALWIKLMFLIIFMGLHPFIDWIEGEGIIISDVTLDAWYSIRGALEPKKKK